MKCKELEQDNKILQCQTKTVVVYNKEFGTFEYIGDPRPLNFSEELTSLKDVLREIQGWVSHNHRLSVGPIFYSLDKGNFGELNETQFTKAFERIGLTLRQGELRILREKLDPRSVGYYKIDPIVRQLTGIPTIDFMPKPLLKLGHLVEDSDLNRNQFRSMISSITTENMSYEEFSKSILALKSANFEISSEEVDVLFKHCAGVQRVQGANISLSRVVAEVFQAVMCVNLKHLSLKRHSQQQQSR